MLLAQRNLLTHRKLGGPAIDADRSAPHGTFADSQTLLIGLDVSMRQQASAVVGGRAGRA
jgi:hypothetical protein